MHDNWSAMGILSKIISLGVYIDISIRRYATVADAFLPMRKRCCRIENPNNLEDEIETMRAPRKDDEHDIHIWQRKSGNLWVLGQLG